MVDDTSSSEDASKSNKGVNVRSENFPAGVHHANTDPCPFCSAISCRCENRSLRRIRNEIQTALDLMGPSTPAITTTTYNTSSEADNEDSAISNTTVTERSQNTVTSSNCCESPKGKGRKTSTSYSSRATRTSASPSPSRATRTSDKDSVMADIGTSSTNMDSSVLDSPQKSKANAKTVRLPPTPTPPPPPPPPPPPQFGAPHICLNPDCMCIMGYMNQTSMPVVPPAVCQAAANTCAKPRPVSVCRKKSLVEWIKDRSIELMTGKQSCSQDCSNTDLYKINISGKDTDATRPKRLTFDLVEGIPRASTTTTDITSINKKRDVYSAAIRSKQLKNEEVKSIKNTKNEKITKEMSDTVILRPQKNYFFDSNGDTRVDFYYFDHGNAHYFHTTDSPPIMKCELIAEKTEKYTTRFWAEFFTSIHVGVAFVVSFILQFFKFILYSILRPLTVGLMQLGSDYCFKPFLTTLFNGIIQPLLIFFYNIATSVRDLCDPIAEACGYFFRELAVLCRSIRLFNYNNCHSEGDCKCDRKYKCAC